jgi:hypothetical protein
MEVGAATLAPIPNYRENLGNCRFVGWRLPNEVGVIS